jgi:tetratricopeptide (TPR) repeat protein
MTDYDRLMADGNAFRQAGRFDEALLHFERASAAVPKSTLPYAEAIYFKGVTFQNREDDSGALPFLQEAFNLLETLNAPAATLANAGAALGLSLLRLHRWPETAAVLERTLPRYAPDKRSDLAGCWHNLAIAATRSGDPKRGVEAAAQAVALHEIIEGVGHPTTVESRLVEAYARVESGDLDGALIHRIAAVILNGAGEAHSYFGDALMVEARRIARVGDGPAAEALARRALHILKGGGAHPSVLDLQRRAALELQRMWRTGAPAKTPKDIVLCRLSLQHTLRRFQAATLDFAPSGDRPKEWLVFVPASRPLTQAAHVAHLIFADLSRDLSAREPSDPHFLDATSAAMSIVTDADLRELKLAELYKARTWEPTVAFSVLRGNVSDELSPQDLARALSARGAPNSAVVTLGVDPMTLSAARADAEGTLRSALHWSPA